MSQTNDQKFGKLLKKYRLNCIDPDVGGPLTQERLVELISHDDGRYIYGPSIISRWQKGERLGSFRERGLQTTLLKVLHQYSNEQGLKTLAQANELLKYLDVRDLTDDEAAAVNSNWVQTEGQQPIQPNDGTETVEDAGAEPAEEEQIYEAPGQNFGRWLAEWVEYIFRFSEADEHMHSSYSGLALYTLDRLNKGVIGGSYSLIITIFALWTFTNLLMSPMWSWQLEDPTTRFYAMIRFGFGSISIPLLIAILTKQETGRELKTDTWRQKAAVFYLKYTGALTAFNVFAVGYFIFPILPLSFSKAFSGLLTSPFTWIILSLPPIFFSHVTAQRIPTDRLKMKGQEPHVLDADRIFGTTFTFFGPGVAYLLYQNYEGFLDPFTGVAVLLFFVNFYIWQQRQEKDNPKNVILAVLQFGFFLPFLATLSYLVINLQELDFSGATVDLSAESILSTLLIAGYGILLIAMYVITLQKNPPQVNFAGTAGLVILMVLIGVLLRIAPYWGAIAFMAPFVIYPFIHRWLRPWFWVHPSLVLAFTLMGTSLALGLRESAPIWLNLVGFWLIAAGLMWWAFKPAYPVDAN